MSVIVSGGSSKSQSKVVAAAQYGALATGLRQFLANRTLVINGQTYKTEDIEQLLQDQIAAMQQVDASHEAWAAAVAAERKGSANIAELVSGLRAYLIAMYGPSPDLQVFGIAVRRKPGRTAKSKAAAVDQALATRKARNTMGPKQRLAIKGVVPTGNTPAPVTPTSNGVGGSH